MIDLCEPDLLAPQFQQHIVFGRGEELDPIWDVYGAESDRTDYSYAIVLYMVEDGVDVEQDVQVALISKTEAALLKDALVAYMHEDFEATRSHCG